MQSERDIPASTWLERALILNIVIHVVAMMAMVLLLLPALPGGGVRDDALRCAYIAAHPWRFRLGWLPWQMTAIADLLLSFALLRTQWIPRVPAMITLILTMAAVIPDQFGQMLWITRGIHLAQSGDVASYLKFERPTFRMIAGWGAIGYLLGALGWTWCFAAAGTWNRRLTWLSVFTWGMFAIVGFSFVSPDSIKPNPVIASSINAIAFVLLELWLIAVTERVLLRSRPETMFGIHQKWESPRHNIIGKCAQWAANSRFARRLLEWLPAPALLSEITDVVYINYLVDAQRLLPLVPSGLRLQRLGSGGQWAAFTCLMYRHGHFGPRFLGPLRRLAPSPLQSNWRIYTEDERDDITGISFVSTTIDRLPHAVVARLLCEAVPMHVPASAELRHEDESITLRLSPGAGSSPDLNAELRVAGRRELSGIWKECFATYGDALAYIVPQDRALSSQPWYGQMTRQQIRLDIPLESVRALSGEVLSEAAERIVGDVRPLCWYVPEVMFRFDRETRIRWAYVKRSS